MIAPKCKIETERGTENIISICFRERSLVYSIQELANEDRL